MPIPKYYYHSMMIPSKYYRNTSARWTDVDSLLQREIKKPSHPLVNFMLSIEEMLTFSCDLNTLACSEYSNFMRILKQRITQVIRKDETKSG